MEHLTNFLIGFSIFYVLYMLLRLKSKNLSSVLIVVIVIAVIATLLNALQINSNVPWAGLNALLTAFLCAAIGGIAYVLFLINQYFIKRSESKSNTRIRQILLPPKRYRIYFLAFFIIGLIIFSYMDARDNHFLYALEYDNLEIVSEQTDVKFIYAWTEFEARFKNKAKFYKYYFGGKDLVIDSDKIEIPNDGYNQATSTYEFVEIKNYELFYIKSGDEYLEAFLTQGDARLKLFSLYAIKYFTYVGIPLLVLTFGYFVYRKWRKRNLIVQDIDHSAAKQTGSNSSGEDFKYEE